MPDELLLPSNLIQEMITHAISCLPEEACGLLVGVGTRVYQLIPIENIEHSPVRYRMKPQEQLRAFLSIEEKGWDLLGIYHSHPNGPETPSERDINEAFYPESVYVIVSRLKEQWVVRGFSIQDGIPQDVTIKINQTE